MAHFERVDKDDISWELYSGDHLQRYLFFTDLYKDKIILDAACGSGYGSEIMIKNGANHVIGIDIDEKIIEKNRKRYSYHNLEFENVSCENIISLQNTFDLVISFETIEHINNPEIFLGQVKQKLKYGGFFICSTPNAIRFSRNKNISANNENPFHKHEFTFEEIKQLLSKHFKICKIYHQSESLSYLRYLEIRNDLFQFQQMVKSSIAFRVETLIRKIFNRPFQPIEFFYPYCNKQSLEDFVIEEIKEPKSWHKTFIFILQNENSIFSH